MTHLKIYCITSAGSRPICIIYEQTVLLYYQIAASENNRTIRKQLTIHIKTDHNELKKKQTDIKLQNRPNNLKLNLLVSCRLTQVTTGVIRHVKYIVNVLYKISNFIVRFTCIAVFLT